jgi:hypothetical protein
MEARNPAASLPVQADAKHMPRMRTDANFLGAQFLPKGLCSRVEVLAR